MRTTLDQMWVKIYWCDEQKELCGEKWSTACGKQIRDRKLWMQIGEMEILNIICFEETLWENTIDSAAHCTSSIESQYSVDCP